MSTDTRPKPTRMTVCDLCDKEISDAEPGERGSLTVGWIAHPVVVGDRPTGWRRTLHAWLQWPPGERLRRASYQKKLADPEQFRERRYDFHGECILRLVEAAIAMRETPGLLAVELGDGERLRLTARPGGAVVVAGVLREGWLHLDPEFQARSGVDLLRPLPGSEEYAEGGVVR